MPTIDERNRMFQKGREAEELLNHPVLKQAFSDLEEAATEKLYSLTTYDEQNTRALWHHVKALRALQGRLAHYVTQAHNERLAMRQEKEWKQQQRDSHYD